MELYKILKQITNKYLFSIPFHNICFDLKRER